MTRPTFWRLPASPSSRGLRDADRGDARQRPRRGRGAAAGRQRRRRAAPFRIAPPDAGRPRPTARAGEHDGAASARPSPVGSERGKDAAAGKRRRRIRPGRPTRQRRPRPLQISTLNKKRDSHGSQATDLGSRAGRPARPRASPAPRRTALAALRGPRDAGPRPPRQAAQSRAPHSLPVTS